MRVACRQGCGVGAGSRRGSVGGFLKAAVGGRRRLRRAAGQRGAAGHTRRAYRPHVRWAPARRPAAHVAAQPRSQQTPLARPSTWAFFMALSRADARRGLSNLPAVLLKRVVGRSLSPSVVRPCAWRAARAAAWVPDRAAGAWVASGRLRRAGAVGCGARRAGAVPPAILAARTARMCGGRPPAAPRPTQPPNRARSRHRWRGPKPGRFVHCRRVPSRASVYCTCQRCC